ncbi:uncharacterized protein DNG_00763 [Cephalotrichum gorgonifer]|uniref:Amino acid permease n=1 Tax=Cephalotrichum gorgonifer TaxID=2041049 RepID=A0AAE8MRU0_9PEZI|nr:uncharacterized protein DNG_00763 [Cephalotrichum gorgonifer]
MTTGLPLHSLAAAGDAPPGAAPSGGKLTRLNGIALVISLQIGSGIFTVPSLVARSVATPGAGVAAWLLGGLLVWTGAASFIELGLRIPANGGILEYMRRCYGDAAGFLFAWAWVLMAKPATNAIIATIFADYITRPFVAGGSASASLLTTVALACVGLLTFINGRGATAGASMANKFLVVKLSAVGLIAVVGCLYFVTGKGAGVAASGAGWFGEPLGQEPVDAWSSVGEFVTALFGALFCYGGWETLGFVLGDMKDPEGDLSYVINGSMTTVITGFVLLNAALYTCLPMDVMRASRTVSVEFARQTLGEWGGVLLCVMVSISAMGALNANIFSTAKIAVTASEVGYFPAILANLHCKSAKDESAFALVLNGVLTSLYVLVGSVGGLVPFIGATEYTFFFASTVGLLILRRMDAVRPSPVTYRTWTGNPLIFSAVSALLVIRALVSEPSLGLAIVGAGLAGMGVFRLTFAGKGSVGV